MSSWQRGTESPMDTSPSGPRKRSIFEEPSKFGVATNGGPFHLHVKPYETALSDVEMASVTPERSPASSEWIDEEPSTPSKPARFLNTSAGSRVRRKRSVRSTPRYNNTSRSNQPSPELLLSYAQSIFNTSLLFTFLYLLFNLVRTVQTDVGEKVRSYEMDILSEITACSASYSANRCGTEMAVPALVAACKEWERCSARDPAVVGRARVTAETFAEILNGFVDAVSWKSMFFSLVTLSIVVGATNSTLSFFKRKQAQQQHHPPPPCYWPSPRKRLNHRVEE